MRRLLLRGNISLICRSALRFIDRSVCRAMGCLFDCFRARDNRPTSNQVSHSRCVNSRRGVASQNRLSALFLSEEKAVLPCPDKGGPSLDSIHIDKGLEDEAKFLKAWGTIPQTPIEIRKQSKKLDTSQHDRDSGSPEFHSWLPNNSSMKFDSAGKIDEPPTPIKTCGEMGRPSVSLEQTPSSCMTNVQISGRISSGSCDADEEGQQSIISAFRDEEDRTGEAVLTPSLVNTQGRTKSVRFQCPSDNVSSSQKKCLRKHEMVGKTSFTVTSPNPTPLKLSNEMQTPGTVFGTSFESAGREKPRIRSQFVYSFSNLLENASLSKVAEESDESLQQARMQDPGEQRESNAPKPEEIYGKNKMEETSDEWISKAEASFSPWLRQSEKDNNGNSGALSAKTPRFAITPCDRPIIGMVAAHWNEEELNQISPKWWCENGIPNSTSKYKEDQKVSWHATPFEERLEKALSEESFICQRRHYTDTDVAMEESEGSGPISQLQHSPESKSVVSC